jgi:hypothetical protein
MRRYILAATLALAFGFVACSSNAGNEQKLADSVTRAVYNNDMSGVTADFSSSLAPQVTRASLGALSDTMHKMGNYQGLTEASTDLPTRRYTFDAKFDNGDMTVLMRLGSDGKIVAYRVSPGAPH